MVTEEVVLKDVQALINISNNFGYNPELITSVEKVNDNQKNILFSKLYKYFNKNLSSLKIAVWGFI